jgi:hypothetical protein
MAGTADAVEAARADASRSVKVNSEPPAPSVERGLEGKVEAGE